MVTKHHPLAQRVLPNFDRKRKGIMSTKIELLVFPYLLRDFSSKKLIFLRRLFYSLFQLRSSRTLITLHPIDFWLQWRLAFWDFHSKHKPFFSRFKKFFAKEFEFISGLNQSTFYPMHFDTSYTRYFFIRIISLRKAQILKKLG